ncbi:phosphate signaling complex protein PhoU [Haloplanus aerogenes]|uniref:Phosphate-specific transport system accessory protein PhoU n=1 Tax=Haloplanus aerogenes TaxID=660522 RepID=A0A3M0DWA4_9EURY|nr:phosphate signaling complex protein PhoU [Haloplanus aerogenes]AZH24596.1 phosphate signaling complex protein PhoU [Haloplanus aerogenes]RMB23746.1 phosphate transport system protein [Haloplanus aerogenes]
MTRDEYQQSLADLRADVLAMGNLVGSRLDRALMALSTVDEAAARAVAGADDEVDRRYLDLESRCIQLLARQQPVASDLRFVASSFKILTDLERVGDLAVNLAQYTLAADRKRFEEVDLSAIGDLAREMLDDAMVAYRTDDAALCRDIAERDDELDVLCQRASERVVRELIEHEVDEGDSWAVEELLDDVSRLLLVVRDLERVGDHAVNIAARTLYMVESDPALV